MSPSLLTPRRLLSAADIEPFAGMTFPLYEDRLASAATDRGVIAVGVSDGSAPLGLALAVREDDPADGLLLSVFVDADARGRGHGSRLLAATAAELSAIGVTSVYAAYKSEGESVAALRRAFDRQGWSPEEPRMYFFTANEECCQAMLASRWMRRESPPPGFETFPWADLTENDREAIEDALDAGTVPATVDPFVDDDAVVPEYSIGLRYKGEVVGWAVLHRTPDGVVRFTALHARERLPAVGVGLKLATEAVVRLINEVRKRGGSACWGSMAGTPFAEFLLRRIVPGMPGIGVTMSVDRTLDLPPAASRR